MDRSLLGKNWQSILSWQIALLILALIFPSNSYSDSYFPVLTRSYPSTYSASFYALTSVNFTVEVTDSGGNLSAVDWYVNGSFKKRTTISGYYSVATWSNIFNSTGIFNIGAVAYDSSNNSSEISWSITIQNRPPGKVTKSTMLPPDQSGNVPLSMDLNWGSVTDPDGDSVQYKVYFGTSSSPPLVSTQSGTSYNPSLSPNTKYYWRIDSTDGDLTTTGDRIYFITANNPPTKATNPNPAHQSSGISVTAYLSWSAATDPDGDPVSYFVCFGTGSTPSCNSSSQTARTYNLGTLAYDTRYYWRIDSWDGSKRTTGDTWYFTTVSPPNRAPEKVTKSTMLPPDQSGNVSLSMDLNWVSVTDPDGDSVQYKVYFGTSSSPSLVSTQSGTSYNPSLSPNTKYYWRIDSTDGDLTTTGDTIYFVTANNPPTKATNPNPAHQSSGITVTTDLSWNAATDPDGDPVSYYVCFGTGSTPSCNDSNQSSTSYSPGTIQPNTTYYWRIDSWDGNKRTTGDIWQFTTEAISSDFTINVETNSYHFSDSNGNSINNFYDFDGLTAIIGTSGSNQDRNDLISELAYLIETGGIATHFDLESYAFYQDSNLIIYLPYTPEQTLIDKLNSYSERYRTYMFILSEIMSSYDHLRYNSSYSSINSFRDEIALALEKLGYSGTAEEKLLSYMNDVANNEVSMSYSEISVGGNTLSILQGFDALSTLKSIKVLGTVGSGVNVISDFCSLWNQVKDFNSYPNAWKFIHSNFLDLYKRSEMLKIFITLKARVNDPAFSNAVDHLQKMLDYENQIESLEAIFLTSNEHLLNHQFADIAFTGASLSAATTSLISSIYYLTTGVAAASTFGTAASALGLVLYAFDGAEDSAYYDEKIRTHEIRQALLFNLYENIKIDKTNLFNILVNNGGALQDYKFLKHYNSIYYGIVTVDLIDGLDAISIEGNTFFEFLANISYWITNTTEYIILNIEDYEQFAQDQLLNYKDEMFVAKEQRYFYSIIDGLLDYSKTKSPQTIDFYVYPTDLGIGLVGDLNATASSGLYVTFSSLTPTICSVTGNAVTGLTPGTCIVEADQEGNSSYEPAPTVTREIIISDPEKSDQTISFTSYPQSLEVGETDTLIAIASSGLVVSFISNTPSICSVSGNGVTGIAEGICTIAAHQVGNAVYNPAPVITETINIYGIVVDPNDPPTLTVISPPNSVTIPNNQTSFDLNGTSSDNDGSVDSVEYRLNGGQWQTATGTLDWSFTVDSLWEGDNSVEIRALDNEGAVSEIASRIITRSMEISNVGLITHLSFDGDATDASPNANHGSFMGNAALTTDRFGNEGFACGFDGAGDYVLIPSAPSLQISDALTVAAWVNIQDTGSHHTLAVQGTSFDTSNNWEVYIHTDGALQISKNNTSLYGMSDGTITFGDWHHVAVTFSAGTAKFYIDGNLDSTKLLGFSSFRTASDGIKIGEREYAAGSGDLLGKIDDLRIYSRALSDAEILDIGNASSNPGAVVMPWIPLLLLGD